MHQKRSKRSYFLPTDLGSMALWLDFDDHTQIFQDTAGTTPITALGQTIKRVSDQSGNGRHFTEATNGPTFAIHEGEKFGAKFNGSQYLSANSAATMDFLYLGSPFTIVADVGVGAFTVDVQTFLDSTNINSFYDGITIYFYTFAQFVLSLTNSYGHASADTKGTSTFVQDNEYMVALSEARTLPTYSAFSFLCASNSSSGDWFVGERKKVTTAAIGSPAPATGPYPARLGASALGGTNGWRQTIRRVWIWNSYLDQRKAAIALTKIREPNYAKRQNY